jgi:predicted RNA binding protein YcfA (HicA-like mRNA interferase family)
LPQTAKDGVCLLELGTFTIGRMTRRLHNWMYREITAFLKENGFRFLEPLKGSHERWIKPGKKGEADKLVEVNFTHASYPLKTLKTMIRQSGIAEKEWIRWAGS